MQLFTLSKLSSSAGLVMLQVLAKVKARTRTFNWYTVLVILALEAYSISHNKNQHNSIKKSNCRDSTRR